MRLAAGSATLALALLAAGCAGYHVGNAKPARLAQVHAIHVPLFHNKTLEPRIESLATNETVAAFQRDGTYRVSSLGSADAILDATVSKITYAQLRPFRNDTFRPFQLRSLITINWTLKDAHNPTKVLDTGYTVGTTNFFVAPDDHTARTNALPDALRDAARSLVSRLADGF